MEKIDVGVILPARRSVAKVGVAAKRKLQGNKKTSRGAPKYETIIFFSPAITDAGVILSSRQKKITGQQENFNRRTEV